MKTVVLFRAGKECVPLNHNTISYHNIVYSRQLYSKNVRDECWVVEYADAELESPHQDPMIVGVTCQDDKVYVVWKNTVWKLATESQIDILSAVFGRNLQKAKS